MTLGDSQPLSRRQARELARDHAEDVDVPVQAAAALRPASFAESAPTPSSRRSSRHHVGGQPESSREAAEATPDHAPTPPETVPPAPVSAPRTLSRREWRALHTPDEQADGAAVDAELVPAPAESAEIDPVDRGPVSADPIVADEASSNAKNRWTPPAGHWSVDAARAEAPQPDQSLDELINHGIGARGIPTTTSALILPSIPHQNNSVSPISNTGEIMITGSFDLPRSLGSTGAHPNQFDSSEMDHVMDQLDADQLGGDSAPVSASRAVSTHASTRGMLTPPKKHRASLPMVLVISTAALAVSVLALFAGFLLGIF